MKHLAVTLFAVSVFAAPAHAGDGALEINQACVATGCFAGDSPGFPVQAASAGSYLLTSNLTVPDANTTAITLGVGASLDLGGFRIGGPTSCTSTPATCTGTGSGSGISAAGQTTIRNGTVKGFGRYGIFAGGDLTAHAIIEDMRVEQNAQGGIYFSNGSVRRANVTLNGGGGIFTVDLGDASAATMIEDCNVAFNKGNGIGGASKIRNCRISYNGGAGLIHNNAGGEISSVSDTLISLNRGKPIDAYGSYRDNEIVSNESVGGQVIGGMSDEGGNHVH